MTPRRLLNGTAATAPTLVVAVLVALALAPSAAAETSSDPCSDLPRAAFTDIDDASVHAAGVDCLVWHGITVGVGFDRFDPGSALPRDQFASLVDRVLTALGAPLPDPIEPRFADVSGVHAEAIERLAEAEIIQGRSARTFAPTDPVQRDQMAAMLIRAYHLVSETEPEPARHGFTDLDGNHHEPMIAEATALGLLHGATTTTFEPRRHTSRAQVASVLAQLLQAVEAETVTGSSSDNGQPRVEPIPGDLQRLMEQTTWEPECPVGPGELRLLRVVHRDFTGTDRWGMLVVHQDVADDVGEAFRALHGEGFRVARMQPVERFGGDDAASMAANNTSAFNCRRVTGGAGWSEHSYGWAIDINPIQNPYVRDGLVLPAAGQDYLDRDRVRSGMLARPGAVEAFDAIGWGWGGDWTSLKDYQHVSLTGS